MRLISLALILLAGPALAGEVCPPAPDRSAERAALFAQLREAPDEAAAEMAADEIWRFWFVAPDSRSGTLLSAALNEIGEGLAASALDTLTALTEYCPHFAEAWNQRATLYFMLGDYPASLADVERVLELEPRHFGALAGKAIMLLRMGEEEQGQAALREAVRIHPWLRERRHLADEPGVDL